MHKSKIACRVTRHHHGQTGRAGPGSSGQTRAGTIRSRIRNAAFGQPANGWGLHAISATAGLVCPTIYSYPCSHSPTVACVPLLPGPRLLLILPSVLFGRLFVCPSASVCDSSCVWECVCVYGCLVYLSAFICLDFMFNLGNAWISIRPTVYGSFARWPLIKT